MVFKIGKCPHVQRSGWGANERMKQTDLNLTCRRTRKRVFLDEMERVVP
ncbi:hypothetical protein CBM2634_U270007 [Cupriavidus taiwanensis]|uniref:Uncharacterized protein n=1 Tax=Cupriavidus taiwanensis TaxID=164546 RepID=A0A375JFH6_9BURK|nr:hypothetical protein CBM2634_U270007 [Cupriavidus taiwanensis]